MCGITGIAYSGGLADAQDIQSMTDAIAHRGPDGEGFIGINTISRKITALSGKKTPIAALPLREFGANADVYLAHRRLAILDLSKAGHQPMSNQARNIWLAFNGEIYNYKSLRNELSEFTFQSNTDTEVLLYAYEKWGRRCLDRLNGMWAFVVYDADRNILFGARDRIVVKPLYYTKNTDFFAFNSEIKGLLANPSVSRKINAGASAAYLKNGLVSFGEETFFADILELPPAHYFIYDLNTKELSIKKYYDLPFCDTWEDFSEVKCKKHIEKTRELVLNAIDTRLNADVTVGSCLSGGMDSSAIVGSINRLLREKPYRSIGNAQGVVTACYENSSLDESKWAKIAAESSGAEWHKVFPQKEELFADLTDLIFSQDTPFGSTSIYAQYRVMKTAKEAGITVMLDGQGGDELFTGYTPYYRMFYDEAFRNKALALLENEKQHSENTPFGENSILKPSAKTMLRRYLPSGAVDFLRSLKRKARGFRDNAYTIIPAGSYKKHSYATLNQMLYTLMSYTSLPDLLKYEDRNSMRFSVESRTPFADDIDLIEYVFSIPSAYKIHNGWSKYLLREAMTGIVPEQIIRRTDKIGFATPEYDWIKTIKPLVFDNINSDINTLINIQKLEREWDDFTSLHNRNGITEIWRYINFILWFRIFKVFS
jgi:asparagine synthase (glutamine-hydrolysing)